MLYPRLLAGCALAVAALAAPVASQWVYAGPDHRLHYRTDSHGNRILDFSYAGYRGGGVRLPKLPVVVTIDPVAGDNTTQIQNALNQAARHEPDAHGTRGAVLLKPGT